MAQYKILVPHGGYAHIVESYTREIPDPELGGPVGSGKEELILNEFPYAIAYGKIVESTNAPKMWVDINGLFNRWLNEDTL
jgi:hypothetical protein